MSTTLSGYKTFRLVVTTANTMVALDTELPSDMTSVTGITFSGNRRDLVLARGRVGARIAGEELIVEGEGTFMYMYGLNHPARVWTFGEVPIDNSSRQLVVRYQDKDVDGAAFTPYTVEVIVSYLKRSVR